VAITKPEHPNVSVVNEVTGRPNGEPTTAVRLGRGEKRLTTSYAELASDADAHRVSAVRRRSMLRWAD
jgi:hypothetical protein